MPTDGSAGELPRKPFVVRAVRALWRLVLDPSYRGKVRLAVFRPATMFQAASVTRANRYPEIFAFVRSQLGEDFNGRILSFGCSTGEELMTLRAYFPHAFIKGIDINPGNIAICRKRLAQLPDPRMAVDCKGSTAGEDATSYDAIFCMAVLREPALKASSVNDCTRYFPFSRFAHAVDDFSRCLKPGRFLIVRHSNFRLCDVPAGAAFATVMRQPYMNPQNTPIFGPDNRRLSGVFYDDVVFQKAPAVAS